MTDEQYQKCPLCSERFNKSGLKPVTFSNIILPQCAGTGTGTGTGSGTGTGTGTTGGGGGKGGEKDKDKEKEKEKDKKHRERHRERKGSEVDVTEGSGDTYTMQLLFIDKNSLFPTLPSSSSSKTQSEAVPTTPKKLKFVTNQIPGSGSSSSAMQPSITTLCECSVVPLNSDSRGKYSRIVTLSVQQYLSAMQQERAELLGYRDECLNSSLDPEYPDLKDFILTATSSGNNNSSSSSSSSSNNGNGNRGRGGRGRNNNRGASSNSAENGKGPKAKASSREPSGSVLLSERLHLSGLSQQRMTRLLCQAYEFSELPVRHNEEHLNADLASDLPWNSG